MNNPDTDRLSIPPDGQPETEQPRWRQDFPIDWPQDTYISRRDFTKFMVLVSLAFTTGQFGLIAQNLWRAGKGEPPVQEISALDKLPVGGTLVFTYPEPDQPRVLVRLGEDTFVAYDQLCTHLSCPVIPEPEAGRLHCPCHEGSFDLATGRPLAGPPRRPLTRVKLEIRGDKIYATGLEERVV